MTSGWDETFAENNGHNQNEDDDRNSTDTNANVEVMTRCEHDSIALLLRVDGNLILKQKEQIDEASSMPLT